MMNIEQWRSAGTFTEFKQHQIFYRHTVDSASNKPVLLLIHGFPTSSWDWAPIWDSLAERFQLVAPDLLGLGFSDKPVQAYSIFEQADIMDHVLSTLNIDQFHMLAHDYGDTVAQELMARHDNGKTLQSVVFSNGGLFPETHHPVLIQRLLLSPIGFLISKLTSYKTFSATFARICAKPIPENDLNTYWDTVNYKQGVRIIHKLMTYMIERRTHRARWVGALSSSTTPIHLIDGVLDPISGEHMVARYEVLVPNGTVDRLCDTGHYPHVESPEAFAHCASAFWDSTLSDEQALNR